MASSGWLKVLDRDEVQMCVRYCAEILNTRFKDTPVVAVCILKGAAFFYVDLVRRLVMPCSCYFIEATSYHNNQTQGSLSIMSSIEPSKFAGRHVILIDELFDNGHTLSEIRTAISQKANVPFDRITTCTLFKKEKQGDLKYPLPDVVGVMVPDVWLVGCGLDDRQEKRGLEDLWACPKTDGIEKSIDDSIFTDAKVYSAMRYTMLGRVHRLE